MSNTTTQGINTPGASANNNLTNLYKVPTTLSEALLLAADLQGTIDEQRQVIARQNAKLNLYADEIEMWRNSVYELQAIDACRDFESDADPMLVSQIAKEYGMNPAAFNGLLDECDVQYRPGRYWYLRRQLKGRGFIKPETYEGDNDPKVTYWTPKGRYFIYLLLKQHGILPLDEETKRK